MPRILSQDHLISMKDAQKIILSSFQYRPKSRTISIKDAKGKILAEPVRSQRTMPPVPLAGPDGIAVKSNDTQGASPENPLKIDGIKVNTGLPMPVGYDAVIPIEEVKVAENGRYQIINSVLPFQNMVTQGKDVVEGQEIIQSGHYLIPYDIAALSNYGIRNVSVKNWKVGMIATGDEIVPIAKEPIPGQIVDTNTLMISGYLHEYGVETETYPITPDNPDIIASRITGACEECDLVLLFGGSSAGSKDFTVDAIEKTGDLLFHGVSMGPGKPVSCGLVQGKPVIGMPGPAIASLITFYQLVFPLLKSWGVPIPAKKVVVGEITENVVPFEGWDVFSLANVRYDEGKISIVPMERRFGPSGGMRADAILHIPRGSKGFQQGEKVPVTLIR